MQDVEFAVVALAGDPAEPLELVPAQRVKPLVTCSVLQQAYAIVELLTFSRVLQKYNADHRLDGKGHTSASIWLSLKHSLQSPLGFHSYGLTV